MPASRIDLSLARATRESHSVRDSTTTVSGTNAYEQPRRTRRRMHEAGDTAAASAVISGEPPPRIRRELASYQASPCGHTVCNAYDERSFTPPNLDYTRSNTTRRGDPDGTSSALPAVIHEQAHQPSVDKNPQRWPSTAQG